MLHFSALKLNKFRNPVKLSNNTTSCSLNFTVAIMKLNSNCQLSKTLIKCNSKNNVHRTLLFLLVTIVFQDYVNKYIAALRQIMWLYLRKVLSAAKTHYIILTDKGLFDKEYTIESHSTTALNKTTTTTEKPLTTSIRQGKRQRHRCWHNSNKLQIFNPTFAALLTAMATVDLAYDGRTMSLCR